MIRYNHLIGLPFKFGEQDCYTLLQRFYADNFGIVFPNYARPTDFWQHGMNPYLDRYLKHGFKVLDCHPSEYQIGDVFLMAIRSSIGNHVGILVENGRVIHHLQDRLSEVTSYNGILRNTTIGVFRHKDVRINQADVTANLLDVLSPTTRRKIDNALKAAGTISQQT